MEVRQLESFLAVLSAGSITGAARLLKRSQPAVTRAIQELEAEIGFDLLYRNGPRVSPTDRGILFHDEVDRLLTAFGHLKERAGAIARREMPPMEIAAIPALAAGLVPSALAALPAEELPSQIHLRSLPAENVIQSVVARSAHIGLTSLPIDHTGIEVHALAEAPCVVALPPDDPLARKGVVAIRDLAGRKLVEMANPYRQRRRINDAFERAGVRVRHFIDTNASMNAVQIVRAGLGIAVIEPVAALSFPVEGVVIRRLDVGIPFIWAVVGALGRPPTTFLSRFVLALDEISRKLLPGYRRLPLSRREDIARTDAGDETQGGVQ